MPAETNLPKKTNGMIVPFFTITSRTDRVAAGDAFVQHYRSGMRAVT
jgi:hypothetical protein